MEFLLVTLNGTQATRGVLIDGEPNGNTGEVLRVEAGTHFIKLDDGDDFIPSYRRPTVSGTTRDTPCEVTFEKA